MIAVYEIADGGDRLFAAGFRSEAHAHKAMSRHRPMRYRLKRYDGRSVRYRHPAGREAVAARLAE